MTPERVAAVDLGAASGRVVAVDFDGERLALSEVRRFANAPVRVGGALRWDVPRLIAEVDAGLATLAAERRPRSVGVDSWGVDYALLDADGTLLELPYSYRDPRTRRVMEDALRIVSREEVFARTGIQFMPINTLYQLHASRRAGSTALERASTLLCMADIFHHHLCGSRVTEYTLATTTQCYEPARRRWSDEILEPLGIRRSLFPDVVAPATRLGVIRAAVAADGPLRDVSVVAPASHDTASAVAATPLRDFGDAYISSGTWSLIGVELPAPVTSAAALAANFTNEGGVEGSYRFLRNVVGLWLFEECRRAWVAAGFVDTAYDALIASAVDAPAFAGLFEPEDHDLVEPGSMPRRILAACAAFGSGTPRTDPGALTRVIFEVLALSYRRALDAIASITGIRPGGIHVVGGGARNALLCQFTADACGIPVFAGPVEATSLGNALVQLLAAGRVHTLAEGRDLVRRSFPPTVYEPRSSSAWQDAYRRFTGAYATRR